MWSSQWIMSEDNSVSDPGYQNEMSPGRNLYCCDYWYPFNVYLVLQLLQGPVMEWFGWYSLHCEPRCYVVLTLKRMEGDVHILIVLKGMRIFPGVVLD